MPDEPQSCPDTCSELIHHVHSLAVLLHFKRSKETRKEPEGTTHLVLLFLSTDLRISRPNSYGNIIKMSWRIIQLKTKIVVVVPVVELRKNITLRDVWKWRPHQRKAVERL